MKYIFFTIFLVFLGCNEGEIKDKPLVLGSKQNGNEVIYFNSTLKDEMRVIKEDKHRIEKIEVNNITSTKHVENKFNFVKGFAILGPLVQARILVYELNSFFKGKDPIFNTLTIDSKSMDFAGSFTIPKILIKPNKYYLIIARKGIDIDPNDDGVSENFVENKGEIHLIISSNDLFKSNFNITLVSEIIYQKIKNLHLKKFNYIDELLNKYAIYLFNSDINGDNMLSYEDVIKFIPTINRGQLKLEDSVYTKLLDNIHSNKKISKKLLNKIFSY